VFGPKVRKYLVLNSNDAQQCYYQAEGVDSGLAKCPTNPNKFSEVSCSVKLSLQDGTISLIRIVCTGPPVLTAAGNYVSKEARGNGLGFLSTCSRIDNMATTLEVATDISEAQGLWVIRNAVDFAIIHYNSLDK
jgi:hypothetical protein